MKCQNCNYTNTDVKAKFCSSCGQELQNNTPTPAKTFESESKVVKVEFSSIFAKIKVIVSKTPKASVKIDGPEKYKKLVTFDLNRGNLTISGNLPGGSFGSYNTSIIQIVRGSNSYIKATINGIELTNKDQLEVTLELPDNSHLIFNQDSVGNAQLGSFNNLNLSNTGSMDISAGTYSVFIADISGSGDLDCEEVTSSSEVSLTGSGDMSLDKCSGIFNADLTGSGDLVIQKADLNKFKISLTGSGDCDVKQGAILDLVVKSSGSGDFDFRGKSIDGSFSSSGSGDISVTSCKNIIKERSSGSGDININ